MLVYRVEHSISKKGPYGYRLDGKAQSVIDNHCDETGRPGPYSECPWGTKEYDMWQQFKASGALFACASMKQLRWWFHGALTSLKAQGFEVVIYEVPDHAVLVMSKQVCFIPHAARKVA